MGSWTPAGAGKPMKGARMGQWHRREGGWTLNPCPKVSLRLNHEFAVPSDGPNSHALLVFLRIFHNVGDFQDNFEYA